MSTTMKKPMVPTMARPNLASLILAMAAAVALAMARLDPLNLVAAVLAAPICLCFTWLYYRLLTPVRRAARAAAAADAAQADWVRVVVMPLSPTWRLLLARLGVGALFLGAWSPDNSAYVVLAGLSLLGIPLGLFAHTHALARIERRAGRRVIVDGAAPCRSPHVELGRPLFNLVPPGEAA